MFIKNVPLYNSFTLSDNKNIIINTKHQISTLENIINNILDKYNEKCKYYIDISNSYYCISFNVPIQQLDAMNDTMFYLYIYINSNNLGVVRLVNEKTEHPEWKLIKSDLIKNLC
jgi:hypothetical protein